MPETPRRNGILAGVAGIALAGSLMSLRGAQAVEMAKALVQSHQPVSDTGAWPPDPNLLFWSGTPEEAARIDPSGKRWFQWARMKERDGDEARAVALFQKAETADPNNFQTLRALAEAQDKAGDAAAALATWQRLIQRYEGPPGTIRAIPELPETYPAFAYAAVAKAAEKTGDHNAAISGYEGAAKVIEAYSLTTPTYQQMELAGAVINHVDVTARRQEVRDLYTEAIRALQSLEPGQSVELTKRQDATLARLDAFAKPDSTPDAGGTPAATSP